MINKNFYRKTNDKKILHKVGKQWKVVSIALLMAIGGAAVATHANANASSTDDLNDASVDETVNFLNQSGAANAPRIAQKQPVQKQNSAKPASQGVHYYPGSNGSAASYFDKAANESGTANKYYNTVNNYVQSLNNEYGVQVNSFANKSASASSAASNDSKLASSYSVTAKNANTTTTINSLAAKHNTTPMLYEGMVQNQEQVYSGEVKSASADVKAASDVASLVNSLEGTDLSTDSLEASASSAIAGSNLVSALANQNSVIARYGGNIGNYTESYVNDANKLSAGANTLQVVANGGTYQADYDQLTAHMNAAEEATLNASLNSDVNTAVTSAKANINSLVSAAVASSDDTTAFDRLDNYANDGDSSIDGNNVLGFNHFVQPDTFGNNSLYNEAVSASADTRVAPALASAANSLYGKYNPEYTDAATLSTEASAAEQSAANEVRAMTYASDFASANSSIVAFVSNGVSHDGGKAEFAENFLKQGVSSLEHDLNVTSASEQPTYTNTISNASSYTSALSASASDRTGSSSAGNLVTSDVFSTGAEGTIATNSTTSSVAAVLSNAAILTSRVASVVSDVANDSSTNYTSALDGLNTTQLSTDFTPNANSASRTLKGSFNNVMSDVISAIGNSDTKLNSAVSSAVNDGTNGVSAASQAGGTSLGTIASDIKSVANSLSIDAGFANPAVDNAGAAGYWGLNVNYNTVYNPNQASANNDHITYNHAGIDALLSDGVDLSTLEAESGAIANVAAAVNAGVKAAPSNESFEEKFNNGLSAASDSADSALGTAQTASANYASANDEDVTLSSYFASSYANDASDEANLSSTESSGLNAFYKSMAADSTFTNADDAYNTAVAAEDNDYKLGAANAKAIYNRSAHFLDVLKGAALHTTPNFNTGNDKVVAKANKGDRLTVYGVNVSRNNSWRGVVRYFVLDNTTGKKGFITGQPNYTKPAYLSAVAEHQNVQVKTLKPVRVYSDLAGKKAIATVPAGKVLDNADVVYGDASEDAHGFTKVETASDDFLTANTDYVAIVVPNVQNNNNTQSNVSGDYVPNNQLNFDKYFNNDTED